MNKEQALLYLEAFESGLRENTDLNQQIVENICRNLNKIRSFIKTQDKKINNYKWKPISEYDRTKYDWVLVKYYDNNDECIPVVAEQRKNGKWYTRDNVEIILEVKYFFDMQELLGEE